MEGRRKNNKSRRSRTDKNPLSRLGACIAIVVFLTAGGANLKGSSKKKTNSRRSHKRVFLPLFFLLLAERTRRAAVRKKGGKGQKTTACEKQQRRGSVAKSLRKNRGQSGRESTQQLQETIKEIPARRSGNTVQYFWEERAKYFTVWKRKGSESGKKGCFLTLLFCGVARDFRNIRRKR